MAVGKCFQMLAKTANPTPVNDLRNETCQLSQAWVRPENFLDYPARGEFQIQDFFAA